MRIGWIAGMHSAGAARPSLVRRNQAGSGDVGRRGRQPRKPHVPDPSPKRGEPVPKETDEQDPLGQPVGRDNIRDGRVGGVMAPPAGTHGGG